MGKKIMVDYMQKQAYNDAKSARWHIQNALEYLKGIDGEPSLEFAANSLINAGQSLYKSAIQTRASYERREATGNVGELTNEDEDLLFLKLIFNNLFKDLEAQKKIDL